MQDDAFLDPSQANGSEPAIALVPYLISIGRTTRQLTTMKLAAAGVLAGQDQLLDALDTVRPCHVVELAAALSVRPSTVSKMLDVFEAKGWAVREADAGDKRRVLARLTRKGAEVKAKVRAAWADLEAELAKGLDEASRRALLACVAQVDGLLAKRLARLR